MNIITLNIRGIGEKRKMEWVRRLRNDHKLSMIGIQETKLEESLLPFNDVSCWGDVDCEFHQVFTTARSGGIISIWDSRVFSKVESIKTRFYIVTLGNLVDINGLTGFINVYGPQSVNEKSKVWEELLAIMSSRLATWIVMGGFNAVRRPEERINSAFCHRSATAFNQFIRNGELTDLKMGGQRFTYFKLHGAKLSKLDRFLVCNNFLSIFP